MTSIDDDGGGDDQVEMARLRRILEQSQAALGKAAIRQEDEDKSSESSDQDSNKKKKENPYQGLLSDEMVDNDGYGEDASDLIVVSKKKKGNKKQRVELTPEEIRAAKQLEKQTQRKLKQLQDRQKQKERRNVLYEKLQKSSISKEQRALLQPSATLGQTLHKKQQLRHLLRKERAGLKLTDEEHDLLYQDRKEVSTNDDNANSNNNTIPKPTLGAQNDDKPMTGKISKRPQQSETLRKIESPKKKQKSTEDKHNNAANQQRTNSLGTNSGKPLMDNDGTHKTSTAYAEEGRGEQQSASEEAIQTRNEDDKPVEAKKGPLSFANMMMASLSALKTSADIKAGQTASEKNNQQEQALLDDEARMEEDLKHAKRYVPGAPIELKTAAALGLPVKELSTSRKVVRIPKRPEEIKVSRYELPVGAQEFEVMDTIRNNDVTIVCGETGSGKSTQVPQYLYETGLTLAHDGKEHNSSSDSHYMIGITQPRRVAAVSTAKRVCYELGEGDGQSIRGAEGRGNLVAYQTRYETAGLGDSTHIKFMTDGILLQEIQSDLLLRKYSVICIDEAHERNLNSDTLIGLLSAAIPMRKQAAAEEGSNLAPLKLVIMSATLRVSDFTENERLFVAKQPAVLKIPGRTFPVTIHHSKVTEIDNYEDVALKKICKIHRKLPQGGILVFLTGKQEIVRMVRRLRSSLRQKARNPPSLDDRRDAQPLDGLDTSIRDMDDEEIDGEIFADSAEYEDGVVLPGEEEKIDKSNHGTAEDGSKIPEKVIVLPLYSMLSTEEQAKVFEPVPEGHRLIVVATNIAETSITIPGISYVVDTGRQKCRNYIAGTGVASYDIMWISKAAANQRAGRAGRTGPGHCYRLYSSSMFDRHLDDFALPEVLTRPLEDVVLAMKAMKIRNVAEFPFPTPPGKEQLKAAVTLLANLGCVDTSTVEVNGGDGEITRLGSAVAKLPLGVRYGKMLLVAAEAGVLDYAIAMVAVLSENSPFLVNGQKVEEEPKGGDGEDSEESNDESEEVSREKRKPHKWMNRSGDVLAGVVAVGAYTYAGRGAGGITEKVACKKFCEKNSLHPTTMSRIQRMRVHLARLAKTRLSAADGIAARTGGILSSMKPPNKAQELLLCQAIASGLLDNVAMLAPLGSIPGEYSFSLRSAYIGCSSKLNEPLLMDRNSVVFSRDPRQLPKWICYDSVVRKTAKDGSPVATLKNITPIDCSWLGPLARGSRLLKTSEPLPTPPPTYNAEEDVVVCSVRTKYGDHGWEIPSMQAEMYSVLQSDQGRSSSHFSSDDSFRWFARYLLDGKVFDELSDLSSMLNDSPALVTRSTPSSKVALLVSALASNGIDSAAALCKHWSKDPKFLLREIKKWVRPDSASQAKSLWTDTVKRQIKIWENGRV